VGHGLARCRSHRPKEVRNEGLTEAALLMEEMVSGPNDKWTLRTGSWLCRGKNPAAILSGYTLVTRHLSELHAEEVRLGGLCISASGDPDNDPDN
jgi:hypothetical protein